MPVSAIDSALLPFLLSLSHSRIPLTRLQTLTQCLNRLTTRARTSETRTANQHVDSSVLHPGSPDTDTPTLVVWILSSLDLNLIIHY